MVRNTIRFEFIFVGQVSPSVRLFSSKKLSTVLVKSLRTYPITIYIEKLPYSQRDTDSPPFDRL